MRIVQSRIITLFLLLLLMASFGGATQAVISPKPEFIDPLTIPKFTNQLGPLAVYVPQNITDNQNNIIRQDYTVTVSEFYQQVLPTIDENGTPTGYSSTKVWGYGGQARDPITGEDLGIVKGAPGPTFETSRGTPVQVKWVNNLMDDKGNPLQYMFAVDPTLDWANPNNIDVKAAKEQTVQGLSPPFPPGYNGTPYTIPGTTIVTNPNGWNAQSPAPIVTHLHGGETPSESDGTPSQWYTPNGIHGDAYRTVSATDPNAAVYYYPNAQEPTTLWYHDHTLGLSRLNVFSGLSGFYLIRDQGDAVSQLLPSGQYEMPLIIQDRTFQADGSFYYSPDGYYPNYNPAPFNYTKENPYALGASLGNTIVVNGKVWPNLNVNRGQYRFRLLEGSNTRFYNISFSNGMPFIIIGTDGGYLKTATSVTSKLFSPAERLDILVDFSNITAGQKIVLKNNALFNLSSTKFPDQLETVGQIMQFTVTSDTGFEPKSLPTELNPNLKGDYPNLPNPTKTRILTLGENILISPALPMDLYLNGQDMNAPISETPIVGSTEDWVLVNTFDTHNIHLHLIQFQIVSRQTYNVTAYWNDWITLNGGMPPFNHSTVDVPSLEPYLTGQPILADPTEHGWKDTVLVFSGQITVIRVRFAQQDGGDFPFDATSGPGYVWHCHILEHENNKMMRPYIVIQSPARTTTIELMIAIVVLIIVIIVASISLKRYRSRSKQKT